MTLDELKLLLGLPLDQNDDDARLSILLQAGIDYAIDYAGQPFTDDAGNLALPALVKVGIAKLVEASDREGVKSESIGGLSQTFETGVALAIANAYFRKYRSFRFVAARRPFASDLDSDGVLLGEQTIVVDGKSNG